MAHDRTTTIKATFDNREAADRAVEHLVQQHGVPRPDVFLQAAGPRNTTGSSPSGGDIGRNDSPLRGEIEVSADISQGQIAAVQRSLGEAGALRVSTR